MLPVKRTAGFRTVAGTVLICVLQFCFATTSRSASLPVFVVVFGQITNEALAAPLNLLGNDPDYDFAGGAGVSHYVTARRILEMI